MNSWIIDPYRNINEAPTKIRGGMGIKNINEASKKSEKSMGFSYEVQNQIYLNKRGRS